MSIRSSIATMAVNGLGHVLAALVGVAIAGTGVTVLMKEMSEEEAAPDEAETAVEEEEEEEEAEAAAEFELDGDADATDEAGGAPLDGGDGNLAAEEPLIDDEAAYGDAGY